MERRGFLKLLGLAPGALALTSDPTRAQERLLSRVRAPEADAPPDQALIRRTFCGECPAACGVRVRLRRGHPIKLEGDGDHPLSRGGLCLRGQASLARLYHPERLRQPLARSGRSGWAPLSWDEALGRIDRALREAERAGRPNLLLSGRTSGTLAEAQRIFCERRHVTRLPELEIFHHGALRIAYETLLGRRAVPAYRIAGEPPVDFLLTLGADLFESFLQPVRFAREVADARAAGLAWMHLESGLTLTGCNAVRHVLRAGSEAHLLAHLLTRLTPRIPWPRELAAATPHVTREEAARQTGLAPEVIEEIARRLQQARRPLTIAGGPATAQANGRATALLAGLLQHATGQIGTTIDFTEAENDAQVGTLIELEEQAPAYADPAPGVFLLARVHTLAATPQLASLVPRATLAVGLSDLLYPALEACDLLLPLSHLLEAGGDAEPVTGLHVRGEAVFAPLHETRSEGAILLALAESAIDESTLRARRWESFGVRDPEVTIARRPATAEPQPALRPGAARAALEALQLAPAAEELTLILGPSLRAHDGRSRPLTLLHEIPDPLSAVSYGDYACLAEETATARGLEEGDHVSITSSGARLRLPIRCQPALPKSCLQAPIDQVLMAGAEAQAEAAAQAQAPLWIDPTTGELLRCLPGIVLEATGEHAPLAVLAGSMEAAGRGILPGDSPGHEATGSQRSPAPRTPHPGSAPQGDPSTAAPAPGNAHDPAPPSLYPPPEHPDTRWAMAIDLDRCTGCSACVAACYLENNIPLVGPAEHRRGREMSWLRIQPYRHAGGLFLLPMLCQHCAAAPCESVCPVYATYHNPEGLNAQVYNRCVGTRYCANNCPYKVRRFNWFAHEREKPLDLLLNPEVSVRPMGVMEKCTFCIQRIREAKDRAKDEGRPVRDGEAVPACAESCPAQAIVFGNLKDDQARVTRWAHDPRGYRVLEELGTEPAVTYLAPRAGGHGDAPREAER